MADIYADVIVDITNEKLDRAFQYRVPEKWKDQIVPGCRVKISFGNGNRRTTGYVIGLSDTPRYDPARIKNIEEPDPDGATVESRLIVLADWMRHTYGSTMIQALKTVLPVKGKGKGKEVREIVLLITPEAAEELLQEYRRKNFRAKVRLLSALLEEPVLDYRKATGEYKIPRETLTGLEQKGIIRIRRTTSFRNPVSMRDNRKRKVCLNEEQQKVLDGIREEWNRGTGRPCLIRGITGSGKTEVYMELIADVLRKGQQAIVLIPEISLTVQNVERFSSRFGDLVTVVHSRMSQAERADQMERAKKGEVSVMIGPRSALFAPFPDLGLIILDEEQENSYKSEGTPRYHARETAIRRAELENAHVVMGSATPSIDAEYACKKGKYREFFLNKRYGKARLPSVWIVDMREELKQGNRSILSEKLKEEMEQRLAKNEQVMLFLNRRGYAGFVSCRSCGHVMKCPHCEVSLTAHNNGTLVCHYCGYTRPQVTRCPSCGSPYIGGFRAGTQQVEQVIAETFPGKSILRMDGDTTRTKDSYEKILSAFAAGKADILIGTQMIVKGHDFPNVTLVGILAADLSLNEADYRSGERTFQLLTQAVGRAGRGEKPGLAVIQTYHPEHYAITSAASQDFDAFYEREMEYRELLGYPPAAGLLAIHGASGEEAHLEKAMEYIRRYLIRKNASGRAQIIGPAKESVSKIKDLYRMVVYVKAENEQELFTLREKLERYIEINEGFRTVYLQFDFNV